MRLQLRHPPPHPSLSQICWWRLSAHRCAKCLSVNRIPPLDIRYGSHREPSASRPVPVVVSLNQQRSGLPSDSAAHQSRADRWQLRLTKKQCTITAEAAEEDLAEVLAGSRAASMPSAGVFL
jgi:hypothetical protein